MDFWDFFEMLFFFRFFLGFLKISLKNVTKIFSSYFPLGPTDLTNIWRGFLCDKCVIARMICQTSNQVEAEGWVYKNAIYGYNGYKLWEKPIFSLIVGHKEMRPGFSNFWWFQIVKYLIGQNFGEQKFRWEKISALTRNFGSFVRRKLFLFLSDK